MEKQQGAHHQLRRAALGISSHSLEYCLLQALTSDGFLGSQEEELPLPAYLEAI